MLEKLQYIGLKNLTGLADLAQNLVGTQLATFQFKCSALNHQEILYFFLKTIFYYHIHINS